MKTHRRKRSESFWPSFVMKKWLNIQPKVYYFSEDEVDTETESEDDACSKDEIVHRGHDGRTQGNFSACCNQTSGRLSEDYSLRHRRGKSETVRGQYINTKDVRVTVGTWNVAGLLPDENLEIDEWLSMQEPSDIYILGFQEVVPLSAGNVLGSENRRPIPKWEAIIRRTLNKSLEPESKPKCYSAPPTPVQRTSSAADLLADTPILDILRDESVNSGHIIDRLKRIYGIDCDSRLDWPERSLDPVPKILASKFNHGRVLTSGLNPTFRYKKVHHGSDGCDQFSEEEDDSELSEGKQEKLLMDAVNSSPRYVRIVSKQMVGIYVSVWVRRRLRRHINNLKVSPVGVGLMGYMGNKGSVSISMSIFQTRLCFVCSHLASGQKEGAEHRRNSDVFEILRRTRFSSVMDIDQPRTIPSHDQIFWFGDLNYRLSLSDEEVRKLIVKKQWEELLKHDQLCKELRTGHVFEEWKEGVINFAPTYKYEMDSDRYVGENPKEGEKKRSPAWCDRILWLGKGIKQLSYKRAEIRLSDHRPISSIFLVEVEIFDHHKLQKVLNVSTAAVHPEIFLDDGGDSAF